MRRRLGPRAAGAEAAALLVVAVHKRGARGVHVPILGVGVCDGGEVERVHAGHEGADAARVGQAVVLVPSSFGHLSSADVCTIASTLRRKLYTEPPLHMSIAPPPPPRLYPLTSKAGKKKLADTRLLLLLSKGDPPPPPKNQKHRCGKCDDCLLSDCGKCASCLDKPKFGGSGCRKQGCKMRRCAHLREFRGKK